MFLTFCWLHQEKSSHHVSKHRTCDNMYIHIPYMFPSLPIHSPTPDYIITFNSQLLQTCFYHSPLLPISHGIFPSMFLSFFYLCINTSKEKLLLFLTFSPSLSFTTFLHPQTSCSRPVSTILPLLPITHGIFPFMYVQFLFLEPHITSLHPYTICVSFSNIHSSTSHYIITSNSQVVQLLSWE